MPPLFRLPDNTQFFLASNSPRRQAFLRELGIPFESIANPYAECSPYPKEGARNYTQRASKAKAEGVSAILPTSQNRRILLGADTVVALKDVILGKPKTEEEALAMLTLLSGKSHTVITSFHVLLLPENTSFSRTDESTVIFHEHDNATLKAYVATGEPMDKAGAYAIQGKGAFLVKRLEGSWSTVVGLPIDLLVHDLLSRHLLLPATSKDE